MKEKLMSAILLVVVVFFIGGQTVQATSGACSSHGGVNCGAGSGLYGQVICNDGWTGSSVSYTSMVECKNPVPVYCPVPTGYGCREESDYAQKKSQYDGLNATSGWLPTSQGQVDALAECRRQIDSYTQGVKSYNKCMTTRYGYNPETRQSGVTPSIEQQAQKEYQQQIDDYNLRCSALTDGNSSYDISSNGCKCDSGYSLVDKVCVSEFKLKMQKLIAEQQEKNAALKVKNQICQDALGPANYNSTTNKCECADPTVLIDGKCAFPRSSTGISKSKPVLVPKKPSSPLALKQEFSTPQVTSSFFATTTTPAPEPGIKIDNPKHESFFSKTQHFFTSLSRYIFNFGH